jgi:glycerol-3-phosphate O-acyltransferase / dihydroxyacetone phosphate acyltransferase
MFFLILNHYNHIYGYLPVSTPTWVIALSSYGFLSMITYASLVFGERGMDLLKSLYPLVLSLSPWSSHIIETLKEERRASVLQVRETVYQLGPALFPDCEDILKWKGRGPMSLYAKISPEVELKDIDGIDDFI